MALGNLKFLSNSLRPIIEKVTLLSPLPPSGLSFFPKPGILSLCSAIFAVFHPKAAAFQHCELKKGPPKQDAVAEGGHAGGGGLWGDAAGAGLGEKWLQVLCMMVLTGECGCKVSRG